MNILRKQDFKKSAHQTFQGTLLKPLLPPDFHPLIQELVHVDYTLDFHYSFDVEKLTVQGEIFFEAQAIDAFNGQKFIFQESLLINELYNTSPEEMNGDLNFLDLDDFALDDFLLREVALNLPITLSGSHGIISGNGLGWEVLSESTYRAQKEKLETQEDKTDSRWDKLDKWKINE